MAFFDIFKSSSKRDSDSDSGSQRKEPTWDTDILTVRQPVSPLAPSAGKHQAEESQMVHSLPFAIYSHPHVFPLSVEWSICTYI